MLRQISYVFTFVIFISSVLSAADWQAFRGPKGDGKSPDTGLLQKWSDGGPKLLWTADFVGFGYSSVAIADDRIYITGNAEREGKEFSMVFCLDKNGKEIWAADNGPAHTTARSYPGTRGTPTIDGDCVYDVSPLGEVACFNAKNGDKIWSRNIMTEYEAPMPRWFLGNAVFVDGDLVICPLGGPKHFAVALDKKTGKTVWAADPIKDPSETKTGYTTPYLFEFEGIRVVIVMSDSTVEGLDPKTGKTFFSIPWKNDRTVNATMPIYRDGNLFLSTGYGFGSKMFKLTKNPDSTISATEVWYEASFDNQHGGVILVGDYVYGSTQRGNWGAIHFMTGKIGYLGRVNGIGQGSIHYADGLLYCLSEDGKTVILTKPEPKEFIELSRFELPNDATGKSWAHPVVLDGKLYLRHAQYLYCYDVKAE